MQGFKKGDRTVSRKNYGWFPAPSDNQLSTLATVSDKLIPLNTGKIAVPVNNCTRCLGNMTKTLSSNGSSSQHNSVPC
jgi:hypothetical protein